MERLTHKAGRNKDKGIGVRGWIIRRDHPMKPSAQSWDIADTSLLCSVRESFIGIKVISGRTCEEERIYSFSCDAT